MAGSKVFDVDFLIISLEILTVETSCLSVGDIKCEMLNLKVTFRQFVYVCYQIAGIYKIDEMVLNRESSVERKRGVKLQSNVQH